ncbi:phosphodiester glycosidase family protein [Motiliproteus sp. MSK22-1]|uniref:phosphodiester glycosidase family protein n=1 Tax=Motiliproteus sp. MSK22-1 TaxID=1897630 RepID=UPI000975FC5C|nr:phosphodiester glycosidase family protein [Motiliproteus sp. MSK22-1]OMH39040.1 hypothetical protein BGP75_04815 [Motiliproteus sp. MSK22-1]
MLSIDDPKLFIKATDPKIVHSSASLKFMVLPIAAKMNAVVRTKEELFEDTIRASYRKNSFLCAVNAMQYALSPLGKADAAIGHDPISPEHTSPDGYIFQAGRQIGRSAPLMFYIADRGRNGYEFGYGNPPPGAQSAIGGLGPIIINELPYGVGNKCPVSANCPPSGAVSEEQKKVITQKNNLTYLDQQQRPKQTGKTIIATSKASGKLLIIVQPNGVTGLSFDEIKGKLIRLGCDNAVFLDGSDSSMLFANGFFHVRQGPNKDETNTVGISFTL